MQRVLLAFGALVTLFVSAPVWGQTCFPECRAGYICNEGTCIEACNPPCAQGQRCTAAKECIAETPHAVPATASGRSVEISGTHVAIGLGSTVGEFYGSVLDLEFGFSMPSGPAMQLSIGGGINAEGNAVAQAGGSFGYRGYFLPGIFKLSLYVAPYANYLAEFGSWTYEYLTVGSKTMIGFCRFSGPRFGWGVEVGATLGYRLQVSDSGGSNYSGLTGGFEGRFRISF